MNEIVQNLKIVDGLDMLVSFNSDPVPLNRLIVYAIQAVFTGSPNGTLKLQMSNDTAEDPNNPPTNWTDLSITAAVAAAGSALLRDTNWAGYSWVRLVWTQSASSGSCPCTAKFTGKG